MITQTQDQEYIKLVDVINKLDTPDNISFQILVFDKTRSSNEILIELLVDGQSLVTGEMKFLNVNYEVFAANVPGVFSFETLEDAIVFLTNGDFKVNLVKIQKAVNSVGWNARVQHVNLITDSDAVYGEGADNYREEDIKVPYWIEDYHNNDLYRAVIETDTMGYPGIPDECFAVKTFGDQAEAEYQLFDDPSMMKLSETEKRIALQQLVQRDGRYAYVRIDWVMSIYVVGSKAVKLVKDIMENFELDAPTAIEKFLKEDVLIDEEHQETEDELREYLTKEVKPCLYV